MKEVIIINTTQNNSLSKAQVITVYKDRYLIEYEGKKVQSEVSGRFKFINIDKSDYPQIGDYVNFRQIDEHLAIIESICERTSTLERMDVGSVGGKHILAANIDLCFICMSLNEDYNIRKLRNFLSLTYDANFETIILLTKKDLCDDIENYIEKTREVTDNQIIVTSSYNDEDIISLKKILANKTAVFTGSSGVGKSTIINKLINEEHFKTNLIRMSDAQGRHTTVNRELINLDNGGKVIDTPGIRIVSSYFVSEESFEDILSLSEGCHFADCKHQKEPGCMVRKALNTGLLDYERFNQYIKAMKYSRFNQKREAERARLLNKRLKRR